MAAFCSSDSNRGRVTAGEADYGDPGDRPVQRKSHRNERLGSMEGAPQAIADEGTRGPGAPLPHLDRIQASFGRHDVSGVQAYTGGAATDASRRLRAMAFATGNKVAFAHAPDLHTAAHEAAHVVQQRVGVSLKGGVGEIGDRYERHANAVADRVVQGRSAENLLDQVPGGGEGGGIQLFSHSAHREATIEGLKGTGLSAKEVGMIYQYNWERDFSQIPPELVDVFLSWKMCVESGRRYEKAQKTKRESCDPSALRELHDTADCEEAQLLKRSVKAFERAVSKFSERVASKGLSAAFQGECYSGYRSYEHMDRPSGAAGASASRKGEMAGYIQQSITYVRYHIAAAVAQHQREIAESTGRSHVVEGNVDGSAPTPNLLAGDLADHWRGQLPKDHDKTTAAGGRNPKRKNGVIRLQASEQARRAGYGSRGKGISKKTAEHLGRATHAIEDFFAHSNWIDLARKTLGGKTVENDELFTGTFGRIDMIHAVSHKVIGLSDEVRTKSDALKRLWNDAHKPQMLKAFPTPTVNLPGEYVSEMVYASLNGAFQNLAKIAEKAGDYAEAEAKKQGSASGVRSHADIAKDDGHHADHGLALKLASRANAMIVARILRSIGERDESAAAAALQSVVGGPGDSRTIVTQVLSAPRPDHPLLKLVPATGGKGP